MEIADFPTVEEVSKSFRRRREIGRSIGECTCAVCSMPRLGFTANFSCAQTAFQTLGIKSQFSTGVFWGQVLTRAIEAHLHDGTRYILTTDYDTVFSPADVMILYNTLQANPEIDAVCAVQIGRETGDPLMCKTDEGGDRWLPVTYDDMRKPLLRLKTAHFGLTMFRAVEFTDLKRPWFLGKPDADGRWEEGRLDEDIYFWDNWFRCGRTLYQANQAVIGHAQQIITWPDQDFLPTHQTTKDYGQIGKPPNVLGGRRTHRTIGQNESFRLNVGAGPIHLDGYEDVDLIFGEAAYPLDWPDESVVEVRASHVLEHFPQHKIRDVLTDWVRVLRPGGVLKVAVPDFDKVIALRQANDPRWPWYLMGGQHDRNDYHKSVHTKDSLDAELYAIGLKDIVPWTSENEDCSSLSVSLNLQGNKP